MKNKNALIFLVLIVIVAPGIHYFVGGRDAEHEALRNALVGIQILAGILFIGWLEWQKRKEAKETN